MSFEGDPGAGDVAGIRGLAKHWRQHADGVRSALRALSDATSHTESDAWKGSSQRSFASLLHEISPSAQKLVAQFDATAEAFDTYATAVERIQDDVRANQLAQASVSTIIAAQSVVLPGLTSAAAAGGATEADAARLRSATHALADADDRMTTLGAAWQQLVEERAAADSAVIAAITGPDSLGALAKLANGGRGLSDADLLHALATLSPTELGALLASDPDIRGRIKGMSPDAVAAFWNSLGGQGTAKHHSAQQDALIALLPRVIGNLGGVPAWARDRANRITLAAATATAKRELADAKREAKGLGWPASEAARQTIDAAQKNLTAYENVAKALQLHEPVRQLVTLDTGFHPPLASVSVGNLDTASNVTYMVPGMGTYTSDMIGWSTAAKNLWATEGKVPGAADDIAVVAWINYKTPPVPSGPGTLGVLDGDAGRAGAIRLNADLAAFNATRPDHPVLNVVGHSYGTTTASDALATKDNNVHSFVMVASAGVERHVDGMSIMNASQYHADAVYAGRGSAGIPGTPDPRDQWAKTGQIASFRRDPMNLDGVHDFGTNGGAGEGLPVTTHDPLAPSTSKEDGYFNLNTESIKNIARATAENGADMTPRDSAGLSEYEKNVLQNMQGTQIW
jgi:uncharacterized protein YukE